MIKSQGNSLPEVKLQVLSGSCRIMASRILLKSYLFNSMRQTGRFVQKIVVLIREIYLFNFFTEGKGSRKTEIDRKKIRNSYVQENYNITPIKFIFLIFI